MSDYTETPTTAGGFSHRSRPSLVTNASGFAESTMSYSSMTTAEGLARLSHFPLPPIGVPLSPFERQLGLSSPVSTQRTMTPPDTPKLPPTADPILPHSGSSIISPSGTAVPISLPLSPPISPVFRARRNLPTPPPSVGSPVRQPLVASSAVSAASSQISPHDWHDGSSSLAMDGYEDRLLPTNLITSLLSTVPQEDDDISPDQPPPRYKRYPYDPSVVSGIVNTESTGPPPVPPLQTPPYTPRHDYPPQHLRNLSYSDEGTARSPTVLSGPLYPPLVPTIPTSDGRVTPESSRTYGSELTEVSRNALRTATYAPGVSRDVTVVGLAHATTRSVAPSVGSMNSTTPLIQSFPRGDVIHEDTVGELSASPGPSSPTTAARRESQRFRENRSVHSTKTSKSYVPSLITRLSPNTAGERRSFKQAVTWFRKKPLPPVPRLPDFSVHQEIEHRRAEATLPLPDLVHRAQALSQMLDKGVPPHHSPIEGRNKFEELYLPPGSSSAAALSHSSGQPGLMSRTRKGRSQDLSGGEWTTTPDTPTRPRRFLVTRRQKIWCGVGVLITIVVIVIAVAVGVAVGKKHNSGPKCDGNFTGMQCTLDATCVCTSTTAGQCNQLAQNLVNLIPTLNSQFNTSFTQTSLSTAVWRAQGSPGKNCVGQARVVDVAPALDVAQFPNRTAWAQAAILWNLVQTQNVSDTLALQKFVTSKSWSALSSSDGPTTRSQTDFTTLSSGFTFNFAAQTATPPPQTFVVAGQPTQAQIGRVNTVANGVLDRMYTFATASSIQQTTALMNYWTGSLTQKAADLPRFVSLVSGSPVLLPFDATNSAGGQKISSLLTNSSTTPFPPPLACYPGLGVTQLQSVNTFETTVFGLSAASTESQFDSTNCYPNRPIYGVLDILKLRLPFVDGRTGLAKQAAVLSRDAGSRVVVYSGEVLSALPANTNMTGITPSMTDPRTFGTLNRFNHVLYEYLTSISDVNVAISLVNFVLSSSIPPPASTTSLFSNIASLPALEVSVFGTVLPGDIQSTYSSFSNPSGGLFMGTDESVAVRDWTLVATPSGGSVVWAELAASPEVVRDNSFTDTFFNSVFSQAFNFFHFPSNATVNVGNVTGAFQNVNKFTP